tara:strand:+ start:1095 stop:1835 length:741 start_codon:yes stop_codon:yes gene_type:complete
MTNKYMYFVANWKMYGRLKTLNSLNKVISFSKGHLKNKSKIIYCPPFTLISGVSQKVKNASIEVGAQNCHESQKYASLTGQVNSNMLKDAGAKFVILGHSENRQTGEENKLINKKITSSLKVGLKVILCIGETLKEKRKKRTTKVLKNQINSCLKGIKKSSKIIIAYEPVWAIGTGLIPKIDNLRKNISFIKNILKNNSVKVLYGGSVNTKNITDLKKIELIDGFLIGGDSRNAKKFIDIIKKTYN